MPLNNFDTIRSYGSAGDELENLPQYSRNFVQNITKANTLHNQNRTPSMNNPSLGMFRSNSGLMPHSAYCPPEDESLHKPWKDALGLSLKEAYYEAGKIQNGLYFENFSLNVFFCATFYYFSFYLFLFFLVLLI